LKELVQNMLDASENAALSVLSTCIQVILVDGEELDIPEDTLNALRKKLEDIVAPIVEQTKSNAERFAAVKIEQLQQHEKNLKLLVERAQARLESKSAQRAEVQEEPSAQVKKRKQLVTQESKA
jgi:hypothetical protein